MKARTKLIVILASVAVVLCGATAAGLALAHRGQATTTAPGQSRSTARQGAPASGDAAVGAQDEARGASGSGAPLTGTGSDAKAAAPSSTTDDSSTGNKADTSAQSSAPSGSAKSGSGSDTSGSSGNSGSKSGTKATTPAPAPAPAPKPATVTVTVDCRSVLSNMSTLKSSKKSIVPSSGVILSTRTVTLQDGDSVFTVLQRACRAAGVSLQYSQMPAYNSAYIVGVGNLDQFDCGPLSGWVYSVNGTFQSTGCSQYKVKAGDTIALRYTCNGGPDVGAGRAF